MNIKETKRDTVYVLMRHHWDTVKLMGVYGSRTDAETARDIAIDKDRADDCVPVGNQRRITYTIFEETVR